MTFPHTAAGARCGALATWVAAAGAALHVAPAAAAPKTDVVTLVNGDRITGEIKGLEHNQLKLSTNHLGTVYIEWDKVEQLVSDQYLLLERSDGTRYYGQLAAGADDAELLVRRDREGRAESVAMASIVQAEPIIGGRFVDRLDGYVSAGFDLAQANDRRSLDFALGLSSRTRIREWSIDSTADLTDDDSDEASEHYELQGTWRRFWRTQDYWQGIGGFESNSELDLNLRIMAGAGVGHYFVRSNSAEWLGGVGLAYSHENYAGGGITDSVEAVLTTEFSIFRYDFPETDIGGSLAILPSLTESGRVRAEADLHAKYEFIDDLYFELELYGSYDSAPPLEGAGQSDYGVTTSLGYSF